MADLQGLFNDMKALADKQRELRRICKEGGYHNHKQEKSQYDINRRVLRVYNIAWVIAKKNKSLFNAERDAKSKIYGTDANTNEPLCELCSEVGALLEHYGFSVPYRTETVGGKTVKVYDLDNCGDM